MKQMNLYLPYFDVLHAQWIYTNSGSQKGKAPMGV